MDYLIVFCWCFLAASIMPASSEPYFVAVVIQRDVLLLPVLVATLGNLLGGMTTFLLGRKGGELSLAKLSDKNKKRYDQAVKYTNKYGAPILILSWIPIIGDVLVAVGGAMRLPLKSSIFWMLLGKLFRYVLIGAAALGLWDYFY